MKRAIRNLALIGACAAGSLSLAACDASPYAASINGHDISVVSLNRQLQEWSANPGFVETFNRNNSQSSGGSGATVAGTGGSGTYSSQFVAEVLGLLVEERIVSQHLAAAGLRPSADELTASRAVNRVEYSTSWTRFSPSLRQELVDQLANEAVLTPVSTDMATLQSDYAQIRPYLFSRVCVHSVAVPDRAAADAMVASGHVSGVEVCYDQQQFEDQPPAFQSAIQNLAVGSIAPPIAEPYGYQVAQVTSRITPGLDEGVKRVLSRVSSPSAPQSVVKLVQSARVKINPAYGTWSNGSVTPPQLKGS